jgi:hypothetical protein
MFSSRSYVLVVVTLPVIVAAGSMAWDFTGFLRECSAWGYSKDRYLAYCESDRYGDYEHGAFYFEIEPEAVASLRKAAVVFLGNSRMQFAFSTKATEAALEHIERTSGYYLLGFGFGENYIFPLTLFERLRLTPRVVVVNADDRFFLREQSPPGVFVTTSRGARINYEMKMNKQRLQQSLCPLESISRLPWCGDLGAIYRSRKTGIWYPDHFRPPSAIDFSMPSGVDWDSIALLAPGVEDFLNRIGVPRECVIFVSSPLAFVDTPLREWSTDTLRELAKRARVSYISTKDRNWTTLDGTHLAPRAAERWSAQILSDMKPLLSRCGVE